MQKQRGYFTPKAHLGNEKDIHGYTWIFGYTWMFPIFGYTWTFVQLQFFSGSLPVYLVQCASLARPLGRKERSQRHRFSRFESINSHPHVGDGDNFCWPLWLPPEEQNLFAQVRGPRQIKKKTCFFGTNDVILSSLKLFAAARCFSWSERKHP